MEQFFKNNKCVVIVTGASKGLGKAIAIALAEVLNEVRSTS